eukprot:gene12989-5351_t
MIASGFMSKFMLSTSLGFRAYRATLASAFPQVVVPPMGDSVSEGTVGGDILKKAGDSVGMDEIIAQIETDKVVIDIKSPIAGLIESMGVKLGDTVVPGTLVASITEGGAGTAPPPPSGAGAAAPTPEVPSASSVQATPEESSHGRVPGINFPQRRLADGTRISDLPEAQQAEATPSSPTPTHAQPPASSPPKPAAPAPPAPPAAPKPKSSGVYLDRMPDKRPLTKSEMEAINSGGA